MKVPFQIAPGLVSDETTFATPGVWVDGNNVRFWLGRPQTIGGWSKAFADTLTGVCRGVLAWSDVDGNTNIAFGTHSNAYVYTAGALTDITPAGLTAGAVDGAGGPGFGTGDYDEGTYGAGTGTEWWARTWSMANYGEWLIANPRGGKIYSWKNNTATDLAQVTNSPAAVNNILVTPERQLLAFGCNEEVSGTLNPMCIRGSDINDIEDWTTSASNNAFEHILEGGGRIVGAKLFGSYVAVWTDTGCHLGQFTGDTGQAYRFDLVASNCGLAGPNAVAIIDQTAYWVTPDFQFYRWQVGAPPQQMPCPIRNDFRDNVVQSQAEKIVAATVTQYREVWFFYPDERDGTENSRYIAVNVDAGTWFKGEMARTAFVDSSPLAYPLGITSGGVVYYHENGHSADGGALTWSITSGDQYLAPADQRILVRGIWPDFEDQLGPVSLTFDYRAYPQATARTKGPYSLAVNRSKKDFLCDGRVIAATFSGSSAPAYMRLGMPTFDIEATGEQ